MEIHIKVLVEKENWEGYILGFTGSRCLIGRGNCDLVLSDTLCSQHHALMYVTADGAVAIRDLDSRHGTRVNGQQIRESKLVTGDVISIGETRLTIQGLSFPQENRSEDSQWSYKHAA